MGSDVAAGVVCCVGLLVCRLEDRDPDLARVVKVVRSTGSVQDELGLEVDRKSPAGLADRAPQLTRRNVQEGR